MLYDPSSGPALTSWLVKTLEPICDAEPEALATYILALLKHDAPENELRSEVTRQLDEFFEDGSSSFVNTLFAALRSKSYIPYTSEPSSSNASVRNGAADSGIPIPLDALMAPSSSAGSSFERGTKRSHESDEADGRGPPKGPRLSNELYHVRMNGDGIVQDSHRRDFGMNGGGNQGGRVMLPRGVCRDYHLKGYCSRGSMCKYSHDEAAFSPQTPMPMNGNATLINMLSSMPFLQNMAQQMAYDPNNAQMDMNPRRNFNGVPLMRPQDSARNGESPVVHDLTPTRQQDVSGNYLQQPTPTGPPNESQDARISVDSSNPSHNSDAHLNGVLRPQRGFRGRGRGGRGTFGGDHQAFNESKDNARNGKTLVIEKIPDDKLSLEGVNDWFKRFGTVTNVAVDAPGKKALVSFSTHDEAKAAWASEEAIFNNRFVKVFWHRPMGGQGSVGTRALEASAPTVANMSAPQPSYSAPKPALKTVPTPRKAVTPSSSELNALKTKQNLLDEQIAEQKELMAKLGSASSAEKKEIMTRLRTLDAEMKAPSTSASNAASDKDKKKRELLDMELEAHSKRTDGDATSSGETRKTLQEELNRLRAEANALGIPDTTYSGPYRGGRGRGRGRASFRGGARGGRPQGSMKLDNRPKALLLKGVSTQDSEVVKTIRSWYEAGNSVSAVDILDDDSVVVRFPSRAAAELGLSKGHNIPSVPSASASWHADNAPFKAQSNAASQGADKKMVTGDDGVGSPRNEDVHEEVGWGNDEDDGMGAF